MEVFYGLSVLNVETFSTLWVLKTTQNYTESRVVFLKKEQHNNWFSRMQPRDLRLLSTPRGYKIY